MTFKETFAGDQPMRWSSLLFGFGVGIAIVIWNPGEQLPAAAAVVAPFLVALVVESIIRFCEWVLYRSVTDTLRAEAEALQSRLKKAESKGTE